VAGARGSVVVKALCYKPEGRGFDTRRGGFETNLILPAALRPGFTQPLTEMSIRKIKIIMFLGCKVRWVRRAANFEPSVSRLSRQCGILNISQPYRPPTACYGDSFTLWRRSVLPVRYKLDCKYCYKYCYLAVSCEPIV
jgi:hypothetical protein